MTAPDGARLIMVIVQPSVNVSNIYRVNLDKTNNQADNVFMQLEASLQREYRAFDFNNPEQQNRAAKRVYTLTLAE
jgi:hypothetical protein